MYQEYPYFIREGWFCPRCKIILNPSTNFCPYCGMKEKPFITNTTNTGIKPEWIYNEDTCTGSIYDNDWRETTINISPTWEDIMRRSGLLDDE